MTREEALKWIEEECVHFEYNQWDKASPLFLKFYDECKMNMSIVIGNKKELARHTLAEYITKRYTKLHKALR